MNDDSLFHFGRSRAVNAMMRGDEQFVLSLTPRSNATAPVATSKRRRGRGTENAGGAPGGKPWTCASPIQVRAMVLGNDTLLVAGPKGEWMHSADAYQGRQGIALLAVSASTGETINDTPLSSLPVFDGMSIANESLYLSLQDGSIVCFTGQ